MSKKEGYIPTEEAGMRAKEKAKRRTLPRVRAEQAKSRRGFGFVELRPESVVEKFLVEERDESRLIEYVNHCLTNIELARQRMSNDQIEIDRLREETRSLIADLMIA